MSRWFSKAPLAARKASNMKSDRCALVVRFGPFWDLPRGGVVVSIDGVDIVVVSIDGVGGVQRMD